MATNWDAPANTKRLIAPASTGENPAALALRPYTRPNPPADTMIPTESWSSCRREAARSIVAAGRRVRIGRRLTDGAGRKGYGWVPRAWRGGCVGRAYRRKVLPQVPSQTT